VGLPRLSKICRAVIDVMFIEYISSNYLSYSLF
jgi:hypothetical protein